MSLVSKRSPAVFTVGVDNNMGMMHYFTPAEIGEWKGYRAKCGAHMNDKRVSIGSLSNTFCMSCWELMGMSVPEKPEKCGKDRNKRKNKSKSAKNEQQRDLF